MDWRHTVQARGTDYKGDIGGLIGRRQDGRLARCPSVLGQCGPRELRHGPARSLPISNPLPYRVNQVPGASIVEAGNAAPQGEFLNRGLLTLAEGAEGLGGQLYRVRDRKGGVGGLVLLCPLRPNYWQGIGKTPTLE